MSKRITDTIALEQVGKLQREIWHFNLVKGRILQQKIYNIKIIKIPISVISRTHYICKKEKSIKK